MYAPRKLRINEVNEMHQFIQQNGFASIVSCDDHQQLSATHLPFLLKKNEGELGTLYAHFAKANPHWKSLLQKPDTTKERNDTMVIFTGPHTYISPTWYKTRPAVPTWNYTAVHAFGEAVMLTEEENIDMLMSMSYFYEPSLKARKEVLNDEITHKLLPAIVGFKMPIRHIEGVEKLGQHKPTDDQKGVYENLKASHQSDDKSLVDYMEKKKLGMGE